MGVLERAKARARAKQTDLQAGESPTDSTSTTLVAVEPQHIARLKGVMGALRGVIEANNDGSGLARMAFLMTTITDELAEELVDYDEIAIRAFMFQIGEVISWIGHGDNSRLPESVLPFAEMIQPQAHAETTRSDRGDESSVNDEIATVVAGVDS